MVGTSNISTQKFQEMLISVIFEQNLLSSFGAFVIFDTFNENRVYALIRFRRKSVQQVTLGGCTFTHMEMLLRYNVEQALN